MLLLLRCCQELCGSAHFLWRRVHCLDHYVYGYECVRLEDLAPCILVVALLGVLRGFSREMVPCSYGSFTDSGTDRQCGGIYRGRLYPASGWKGPG